MEDLDINTSRYEAVRVSHAADEVATRLERRQAARRNLLAMCFEAFGITLQPGDAKTPEGLQRIDTIARRDHDRARVAVGDFARLADILGLEAPVEYEPGMCHRDGCDREIPLSSMNGMTDWERKGFCSLKCERTENIRKGREAKG